MLLDPLETVSQLVAIPSVNPMGRDVSGEEFCESRLTDHLQSVFARLGLCHDRQQVEPGRENVVARLDGDVPPERGGQVILFDAHQDTVPVDGMSIEPWTPVVRDGRLYGRGSCDTKGAMAAMLVAVSRLAEERPAGMPTIIISCPVNEEFGFTGARELTRLWTGTSSSRSEAIFPRRPDAAVVGEPTGLDVIVAHKGTVRWQVHARGRAAHSARPEAGENAIYRMARVLPVLERYQAEAVHSCPSHPLCGGATLSVGTIRGGISVNTVPDHCWIEVDRRVPPGENMHRAYRHVLDFLAAAGGIDFPVEHDEPSLLLPPLSDECNGPLSDRLAAVVGEVAGRCAKGGESYSTHAAIFSAAGVPSVVFGPGFSRQAHTDDEWLPLDQLELAAEVLYRFGRKGLRS